MTSESVWNRKMNEKPIAVLGGGAGAHMMAADLTSRGHAVHLYEHPRFAAKFSTMLRSKTIECSGIGPVGEFRIAKATTNIAEAVRGVEWINVVIPATGHELFFGELLRAVRPGQKVVVWAGDFGSLRLRKMLADAGKGKGKAPTIIETNTLPYGTRLMGPGRIKLLVVAPRVMAAALPARGGDRAVAALKRLFPCIMPGESVLAAAFNNPNPIVHPPGSLLNTGRIEFSGGNFYMYGEGITESVARVIREIYEESRRVAERLGFGMMQYQEADFTTKCSIMGVEFVAPFDTQGVIGSILGPCSVQDRYITEDLPYGLVPRSELGRLVGVPTPVIDGIISVGAVVCREDYWQTGRTLAKLGLAGMSKEQIRRVVEG